MTLPSGVVAANPVKDGPLFVGREKECARIQAALEEGTNFTLSGAYGMGRTALLHHLARSLKERWRFLFLDGAAPPADLCRRMDLDLFPMKVWTAKRMALKLPELRHRIEHLRPSDPRPAVLVLDEVDKITEPRLEFLRWLTHLQRFRIIAVVDHAFPERALMRLRAAMYPAPLLTLGHLTPAAARHFFEAFAARHHLSWGMEHIHGLVVATHGYPLGMQAAVASLDTTEP